MRKRPLGKTGWEISELCLGTWGLSGDGYGPIPEGEAERVVRRALAMGINGFETAAHYGSGVTQETLGRLLQDKEQAILITRIGTDVSSEPPRKDFSAEALKREAETARKQLGERAKLVVLLHNPSLRAMTQGAPGVLAQLNESGAIDSWGVSAGSEEVAKAALSEHSPIVSFAYNALQVHPLRHLKDALASAETGVLVHSVLAYGLLAGRWPPSKHFPYGDHRAERWPHGALRRRVTQLNALRPMISGDVTSLRSAALRFALSETSVSSAVIGPRNGAQLDQLVRDLQGELPYLSQGKLEALESRLDHLDVPR